MLRIYIKNPLHCQSDRAEDVCLRGSTSLVPCALFCTLKTAYRNHSFDCNVSQRAVLKPLGAGFQMLPAKALSALRASLCYFPHSTLLVNVLFFILFAQKAYFYSMPDNFKSKVLIFSFYHFSGKCRANSLHNFFATAYAFFPQHFLYFLPLPQGQGSLG